jgi:hypothetical protein
MTIPIELTPDEERLLREQARLCGRDPAQYAHDIIRGHVSRAEGSASAVESLLDHDSLAYCEREADDHVTLKQVLKATSKIQDSMARVIMEEERAVKRIAK